MNALQKVLAAVKARFSRASHSSEPQPHQHFQSLPPKRNRNRHSQRSFQHHDRTLAPDPDAEEQ
jgi:hypothetical protein